MYLVPFFNQTSRLKFPVFSNSTKVLSKSIEVGMNFFSTIPSSLLNEFVRFTFAFAAKVPKMIDNISPLIETRL